MEDCMSVGQVDNGNCIKAQDPGMKAWQKALHCFATGL